MPPPTYDQIAQITGVDRDTIKKVILAFGYTPSVASDMEIALRALLRQMLAALEEAADAIDPPRTLDEELALETIRAAIAQAKGTI